MNKKGLSPVIATVLLIVLVIIIALIIFLWARSFVGEAVQKQGASAEQKCGEISLDVLVSGGDLYVTNTGSVPVYSLKVKINSGGSESVETLEKVNLAGGQSGTYPGISGIDSADSVKVVPVVMGETKDSVKQEFICEKISIEASKE